MKQLTKKKKEELIQVLAGLEAGILRKETSEQGKVFLMGENGIKAIYSVQYLEAIKKRVDKGEIQRAEIETEVNRIRGDEEEARANLEAHLQDFKPTFQSVVFYVGQPYYFMEFATEEKAVSRITNGKDILEVLTVKLKQITNE